MVVLVEDVVEREREEPGSLSGPPARTLGGGATMVDSRTPGGAGEDEKWRMSIVVIGICTFRTA